MDVFEYFLQREREIDDLSLAPDGDYWNMVAAEAGSDDKRGRIFGHLLLLDDAYLQVYEVIVVEENHVHREEYAYYLIIGGEEIWGYERDPTHDPPVHRHSIGHIRHDAGLVSFKQAAELAWEEVSRRRVSQD